MFTLIIQQAQGGFVLTLEKASRGGTPELSVATDGADMFMQLINCVPGMADAAWDWAAAEMQRRMEAERGVSVDS
jgi:hypothetical protein